MLGGDVRGQRLNTLYRENIDETEILAALDTLFDDSRQNAQTAKRSAISCIAPRIVVAPDALPLEA